MNPLNKFNNNQMQNQQLNNNNNPTQMVNNFMEFAKGVQGNPEEEVMKLLSNGQMTQEQFNQLSQQAKQLEGMFKQFGIFK